jgi:hypothetical protein
VRSIREDPPVFSGETIEKSGFSPPAFFGSFRATLTAEHAVRFVSDMHQQRLLAGARQHFKEQSALLSNVSKAFNELEASIVGWPRMYASELRFTEHVAHLQSEAIDEQSQALVAHLASETAHEQRKRLAELREMASRLTQTLEDGATSLLESLRSVASYPTIDVGLGGSITIQITAVIAHERVLLAVDATWKSGTPGRNIDVRAMSREPETIQANRTDASGHAHFQLDRRRYKIELEHAAHGAGGLIVDFSNVETVASTARRH